ncbi:hypothetical protein CAPN002_25970 [Capnocytophaga stomatis]|uniref:hypothetical protein n=1 Tax=Capnocytophaga stomatis TaxID=1848904 RepID=UPI00194FCA41|nr:hypothetical protein [Capnocytophaga stomatis]GIJ95379.1 hypothetical protein CAPN002_25970 [Capnocytophaga stomatis]
MKKKQQEKSSIIFRISKKQKTKWKQLCSEKKITLTDLIVSSVENKLSNQENREIIKFIEKQDNLFAKIENNINQFAKIANTKKEVDDFELKIFTEKLKDLQRLKEIQNQIFNNIYKLMANDSKNS